MNVLYIAGHLSDADFVEHELSKIAPHIHIDVSPRNADALTRISAAGKYDAVLLDPLLPGGENLIACIREQKMPLAVIVMTGAADGTPPLEMLRAGADDYIVKRPHFVDVLPLILQRVIARRQSGENRDAAPDPGRAAEADRARIEKEQDTLNAQWLEERAKYEEERVLLLDATRASEAKSAAAEERHRIEKEEWQAVRQEMEWQRLALEEALRAAELSQSQVAEQSRKERAEWETARQELETQLREVEGRRASLAEVLHEIETRIAALEEQHRNELAEWNAARIELETKCVELEASSAGTASRCASLEEMLQAAERRCAELEEKCRGERGEHEKTLQELQLRCEELTARAAALDPALADSEARALRIEEQYRLEKAGWETAHQHMEQHLEWIEEELHALQERHGEVSAQLQVERANRNAEQQERMSQLEAAESRVAAAAEKCQAMQARIAELDELRRTESAALESERRELAQRQCELRETLGILVKALEASDAYQAQLLEERRLETERQSATRRALEEVLRVASGERQLEPLHELVAAAMTAFADLTAPVIDCGALLMEFLDPDDPRRERARLLMEAARRAGDLAVRLLAQGASREFIDLNLCVSEILGNLRSMAGERVDLLTILSPTLPHVQATRPRTERLLEAVLQSARDTLPLGGTITLETAVRGYDEVSEPRSGVLLSVTASGNGAHAEVDTVPLEPLVSACGGKLSITGDSETGTSIEIILPSKDQDTNS
ncbi:MAG: hypothetical protein ABSC02_07315 [Acidobacteriota bacterium]|jgi:DNA-binding response OmpR family regulator